MSPSTSFLASERPPRMRAFDEALLGEEAADRAEHAVLGDGVRVLVRVRHARGRR